MLTKLLLGILLLPLLSAVQVSAQRGPLEGLTALYASEINEGQIGFMWLGEGRDEWAGVASAGVIIRTFNHSVIIDPSNIVTDDAISVIQSLDLILITHEHSDHFNPDATVALHQKTDAIVLASAGTHPFLQGKIGEAKLIEMLPNDVEITGDVKIRAIPADHPSDRPVMYLIEMDGFTILHASDSGFVDELNNINSEVHLAFVPAGGASPTASPEEAANMVRAVKPYLTVPVHAIFEQMKALNDITTGDTAVLIPSASVVYVPDQIVPEFEIASVIFLAALSSVVLAFVVRGFPIR